MQVMANITNTTTPSLHGVPDPEKPTSCVTNLQNTKTLDLTTGIFFIWMAVQVIIEVLPAWNDYLIRWLKSSRTQVEIVALQGIQYVVWNRININRYYSHRDSCLRCGLLQEAWVSIIREELRGAVQELKDFIPVAESIIIGRQKLLRPWTPQQSRLNVTPKPAMLLLNAWSNLNGCRETQVRGPQWISLLE